MSVLVASFSRESDFPFTGGVGGNKDMRMSNFSEDVKKGHFHVQILGLP